MLEKDAAGSVPAAALVGAEQALAEATAEVRTRDGSNAQNSTRVGGWG